jgi:uncharacterized protein (UPF0261 family)
MEVLCIGTADTKGKELLFLASRLRSALAADSKVYTRIYPVLSPSLPYERDPSPSEFGIARAGLQVVVPCIFFP